MFHYSSLTILSCQVSVDSIISSNQQVLARASPALSLRRRAFARASTSIVQRRFLSFLRRLYLFRFSGAKLQDSLVRIQLIHLANPSLTRQERLIRVQFLQGRIALIPRPSNNTLARRRLEDEGFDCKYNIQEGQFLRDKKSQGRASVTIAKGLAAGRRKTQQALLRELGGLRRLSAGAGGKHCLGSSEGLERARGLSTLNIGFPMSIQIAIISSMQEPRV